MGTMVDFAYRFEGRSDEIKQARAAIEAFQVETADFSGNGDCEFGQKPTMADDGGMTWHCYSTRHVNDFEAAIVSLTAVSSLRCIAYWGCTDGYSAAGLNRFENGAEFTDGEWEADIGLNAALAIRNLSVSSSVECLLVLVEALHVASRDGWDEDDYPWLLKADVIARAMLAALASHPNLADSKLVAEALVDMKNALEDVRESLKELAGYDASRLQEIDGLLSIIEGWEIGRAVPEAAPGKKRGFSI